jgi:hypothetical protein
MTLKPHHIRQKEIADCIIKSVISLISYLKKLKLKRVKPPKFIFFTEEDPHYVLHTGFPSFLAVMVKENSSWIAEPIKVYDTAATFDEVKEKCEVAQQKYWFKYIKRA